MVCEFYVKDGTCDGVDYCGYSDDPWARPCHGVPDERCKEVDS